MDTTTSFSKFTDNLMYLTYTDIYNLYHVVADVVEEERISTISEGGFTCSSKLQNGKEIYFVKHSFSSDYMLMLTSEKARTTFLKHIEHTLADGNIEGFYGFNYAMENTD